MFLGGRYQRISVFGCDTDYKQGMSYILLEVGSLTEQHRMLQDCEGEKENERSKRRNLN